MPTPTHSDAMMPTVKLKPPTNGLHEAFNMGFQFHILDNSGKAAMAEPMNCKDYITDMFWCEYAKKNTSSKGICGFVWKHGKISIESPSFFLGVTLSGHAWTEDERRNASFLLNDMETALGFPHTKVTLANNAGLLVYKYPKEWTEAAYLVSAATSLMRMGPLYPAPKPVVKAFAESMFPIPNAPRWLVEKDRWTARYGDAALGSRLLHLAKGKLYQQQPYSAFSNDYGPHSEGILGGTLAPMK